MPDIIDATPRLAGARRLDGLTVLNLRMLPGDTAAQQAVLDAGLPWVKVPGELAGTGPVVAWRGPHDLLVLAHDAAPLNALRHALAPGRHATALAVDLSEALVTIELHGPALDDWLAHLVDASAIPREAGRAGRCRLADVSVMLMRLAGDRLWLSVDRPLLPYVTDWLPFTHGGALAGAP